MPASFFLFNKSFTYQNGISIVELESKIFDLSNDYTFIRRNQEAILLQESIYYEEIYPGIQLWQLLYDTTLKTEFSRDVKRYLTIIIRNSTKTELSNEEILLLLDRHDEGNVYGLLCLHPIEGIGKEYLVYSRHDWFDFHRYFLSLYPISEAHFYSECKKYFLHLFINENIIDSLGTIEGGFRNFVKTIVFCLSSLNDNFTMLYRIAHESGKIDLPNILRKFSSLTGIETSLEGNSRHKKDLTFKFSYENENEEIITEEICCEPHMKLSRSDNPGDSNFYFNRLHFHSGRPYIYNGCVLIGYIGRHINFG